MAILTVNESVELLKKLTHRSMNDGYVILQPSYARAILDVLQAFETVSATCDALQAQIDAVPLQAIVKVFNAADNDGYYNDDVAEWLMENGVKL